MNNVRRFEFSHPLLSALLSAVAAPSLYMDLFEEDAKRSRLLRLLSRASRILGGVVTALDWGPVAWATLKTAVADLG